MLFMIKMIYERILNNKIYLLMATLVTPIVVIASMLFTNQIQTKPAIAIIGQVPIQIQNAIILPIDEPPAFSELVQGKYDAVVRYEQGNYEIETIRGEAFKQSLQTALKEQSTTLVTSKRGNVTNLIGFITMFILVFSSMLFKFYYEEKTGINKRILSTSLNYISYTLSHILVVFSIIFFPTAILIVGTNLIVPFHPLVTNGHLLLILFTLCLLGTGFSFFISSFVKKEENGGLVATMIIVITTLISGSFFEVNNDAVTDSLTHLFPQKYLLDYTTALESNMPANNISLVIILLASIGMILLGIGMNKKITRQS